MAEDWFDQNKPQSAAHAGDWFTKNAPKPTPPPHEPSFGERALKFTQEHPYVTAAASLLPGMAGLSPDVGKGALKTVGRDLYEATKFAGPLGMAGHAIAERTGIGDKIRKATEASTPGEKVGEYATSVAEFAIPGPAEVKESETLGRLGKGLQASAEKGYGQVLNATTRGNKARTAKVVPEMLDRGVKALSLKGLGEKTTQGLTAATEKLEDAYAGLPADAAVPADGVLSSLMARAKDAFEVNGKSMSPQSDTALALAKELGTRLMDAAVVDPATGNKVIPVEFARHTRQIYDEVSRAAGRFEGKPLADHSSGVVHGMAADAIREMLNQVAAGKSNIEALNREYNFWRNADTVIQETILRRQGQAKPLGRKLAAAGGAVAGAVAGGPKGAALGYEAMKAVEAATNSAAWKTTTAVMKSRLAKAIASGNEQASTAIANAIAKGIVLGDARSQ